jgi:hypothetical protein
MKDWGNALVVGSLFGFGAWMAQTWYLSVEEWHRILNELLSEFGVPPVPRARPTVAQLERELSPNKQDARYYAKQIKRIINEIKELDGRPDGNG